MTVDFEKGTVLGSTKISAVSEPGMLYYIYGDVFIYNGQKKNTIDGLNQYTLNSNIAQVDEGDVITVVVTELNELGDEVVVAYTNHTLVSNEIRIGIDDGDQD